MMPALHALQDYSSTIQAFSAVVIAVLTAFLWWSTRRYADTAKDQFGEMTRQREADVMPVVHVTSGSVSQLAPSGLANSQLSFHILNVGRGPALSLYAYLRHAQFEAVRLGYARSRKVMQLVSGVSQPSHVETTEWDFAADSTPTLLAAGEEIEVRLQVRDVEGHLQPQTEDAQLCIEYRNILGAWWRTRTAVRLGIDTAGTQITRVAVTPQYQTELYRRIRAPRILQDTLRVDDSPWETDEFAAS